MLVGTCGGGGGGVGGGLIDLSSGLVSAVRYRYVNGEVVDTQLTCIDLGEAEDVAWDVVSSAASALPEYGWESDPDSAISSGLTGLPTYLWTSHETQVGPIAATWIDPVTGIAFAVEGRGWTERITWDTGDGTYDAFAARFDSAPGLGGTATTPAASHVYETTSAARGHADGYPVALELEWVGEYRTGVSIAGATVWTTWARMSSTLPETFVDTYTVVQVRSSLDE